MSADAAEWINSVVAERAPQAVGCLDPYRLIAWVTDALDQVRRQVWNTARGGKVRRTAQGATPRDRRGQGPRRGFLLKAWPRWAIRSRVERHPGRRHVFMLIISRGLVWTSIVATLVGVLSVLVGAPMPS